MKLAEDMVSRGSITTFNNNQLQLQNQSQLSTTTPIGPQVNTSMAHVSPTITVHGNNDHHASYGGITVNHGQNSSVLGSADFEITCSNFNNSDAVSSLTSIYGRNRF